MAKFALQLYTVREPAKKDLPGTLKRARDIGYEYVQWSGMPELPAEEIRAALDDAGLKAVAGHASVEGFEKDFSAELRYWKTIGVTHLAPGGMPSENRESLDAWKKGAARLDRIGATLREAGVQYSYHNHASEFEKFEGDDRYPIDILMAETKPENLRWEMDLAWVYYGGEDPAACLRKYKGRCPIIHIKDVAKDAPEGKHVFTELGRGLLDWNIILPAAREAGVEWYAYEQDTCPGDPLESARISYEFLKANIQ
jgi:sugar phosphate isomerase/epimerase